MTQLILMLGQLILLPLQLRLWGQIETAHWYSALAVATATYFVDCGLRTAGHSELVKVTANPGMFQSEQLYFQRVWSWIRVLVLIVSVVLITADFVRGGLLHWGDFAPWHAWLIIGCALETLLIIRIMYFDSLTHYRGAEASYFAFAVLRLGLSVVALVQFHTGAAALAVIYLVSAAVALGIQEYWLCPAAPLLRLNATYSKLVWEVLVLTRHTLAEPVANWVRLSLPVLVIGQLAAPMAVTTYVALRAVFGAGRTTIQQLARVASVEAIKAETQGEAQKAGALLRLFILVSICFGSCLALFVIIDNLRVLGLWLKNSDRSLFQNFVLAFALTAPFFCYQIPVNLMFRTGRLAAVAHRHYLFVGLSLLFAGASILVRSMSVYLGMLVIAEVLLSIAFLASSGSNVVMAESKAGRMAIRTAALASVGLTLIWLVIRRDAAGLFTRFGVWPITLSSALWLAIALGMATSIWIGQSASASRAAAIAK